MTLPKRPPPSPFQPKSGLPDFGHSLARPKSETSDFGWEGAHKRASVGRNSDSKRSPHDAKRNAGSSFVSTNSDCASLHPGCARCPRGSADHSTLFQWMPRATVMAPPMAGQFDDFVRRHILMCRRQSELR